MVKKKGFIVAIIFIAIIFIILIVSIYRQNSIKNNIKYDNVQIQTKIENNVKDEVKNNIKDNIENNVENKSENNIKDNIENNDTNKKNEKYNTPKNNIGLIEEKTKEKKQNENSTVKNNTTISNIQEKTENITSSFDENQFVDGHLKNYPSFGEQYATLKIKKINVNALIYLGATSENLLKGVTHDNNSYFPGENSTVIMCGHNYMNNFKRLGELENGDIIEVKTNYGDFYYKLYDKQVVKETETDKLTIQRDSEKLMIYTCYPFNNKEYTEYRYVIYANKI